MKKDAIKNGQLKPAMGQDGLLKNGKNNRALIIFINNPSLLKHGESFKFDFQKLRMEKYNFL